MKIWLSRLLIGLVTAWNLQAAFAFIFSPDGFVRAYELSGVPGEAAIRGVGVLFLMWNVPYLFALVDPVRYRLALTLSLLMQLTGLVGEIYIYFILPAGHAVLGGSIYGLLLSMVRGWFCWWLHGGKENFHESMSDLDTWSCLTFLNCPE